MGHDASPFRRRFISKKRTELPSAPVRSLISGNS
jgi:hypothetical protein